MYYVYAIFNYRYCKLYIGQTKNLSSRLMLHNDHTFKGYTAKFDGKWEIIYKEEINTRQEAQKREKQLKVIEEESLSKHL